jgi:hypothetical protein
MVTLLGLVVQPIQVDVDESSVTGNSVGLTTWGRGARFRVITAGDLSAIDFILTQTILAMRLLE